MVELGLDSKGFEELYLHVRQRTKDLELKKISRIFLNKLKSNESICQNEINLFLTNLKKEHTIPILKTIKEKENFILKYLKSWSPEKDCFYESSSWRSLRYKVLSKSERKCVLCGNKKDLHVDHIKPRSKYPELELDINNLQVLCKDCNLGKSNTYEIDFR